MSIEDMMQLFKGGSSHWINQNALLVEKFAWGRGYGVFSVSHSSVSKAAKYICQPGSFSEEFRLLVERYGLKWQDDKTVETVNKTSAPSTPR